ncbi:MAG: hypothetical protein ACLU4J_18290 [Butyricimonas paravirosa]
MPGRYPYRRGFEIIHERCEPHFTEQLFECRILNGGEDILWWSERSGWGQYYLYNKEGQLKNPVTTGDFVAGELRRWTRWDVVSCLRGMVGRRNKSGVSSFL